MAHGNAHHFPYNLTEIKKTSGYGLLRTTPYGNTYTVDFAINSIEAEQLGKDYFTDILALSFSSPDYIGHVFGVHSIEVEDTYIRLDRDLERLLTYLDKEIGRNNYLLVLTADHAGAYTPQYLQDIKVPAGVFNPSYIDSLSQHLSEKFGVQKWILKYQNAQLYLNTSLPVYQSRESEIKEESIRFLQSVHGIAQVIDNKHTNQLTSNPFVHKIHQGVYAKRSGDLSILFEPGWFDNEAFKKGGTTHGSGYMYDTHVPLLWLGHKVKHGTSSEEVYITDIAPTISGWLNISTPNGSIGRNRKEMIQR